MKKAFITGINGQDGSYLAELLLNKNLFSDFIYSSYAPLKIIENDYFLEICKFFLKIGNNLKIEMHDEIENKIFPKRFCIRSKIIEKSEEIIQKNKLIIDKIKSNNNLSIITDLWSCNYTNVSYMNVILIYSEFNSFKL